GRALRARARHGALLEAQPDRVGRAARDAGAARRARRAAATRAFPRRLHARAPSLRRACHAASQGRALRRASRPPVALVARRGVRAGAIGSRPRRGQVRRDGAFSALGNLWRSRTSSPQASRPRAGGGPFFSWKWVPAFAGTTAGRPLVPAF